MRYLDVTMQYLDLSIWPRRKHFEFFRKYEHPFFNVTVQLDVTGLWERSRIDDSYAFATAIHYAALEAANQIDCLRYRIRGESVLVHDVIHGGATVLLDDDTFTFCYFESDDDFEKFQTGMRASMDQARSGEMEFDAKDERDDLIHFTTLPWIAFTGFQHPRRSIPDDSVPKIVFGKCHESAGVFKLPVAVDVHHALVDGLHVGDFFTRLEANFADPPI